MRGHPGIAPPPSRIHRQPGRPCGPPPQAHPPERSPAMRAVAYRGPRSMAVEEVEDPKVEQPGDALLEVTTTAICGSDLHMYEGRTGQEEGAVIGLEIMGVIREVGDG